MERLFNFFFGNWRSTGGTVIAIIIALNVFNDSARHSALQSIFTILNELLPLLLILFLIVFFWRKIFSRGR